MAWLFGVRGRDGTGAKQGGQFLKAAQHIAGQDLETKVHKGLHLWVFDKAGNQPLCRFAAHQLPSRFPLARSQCFEQGNGDILKPRIKAEGAGVIRLDHHAVHIVFETLPQACPIAFEDLLKRNDQPVHKRNQPRQPEVVGKGVGAAGQPALPGFCP